MIIKQSDGWKKLGINATTIKVSGEPVEVFVGKLQDEANNTFSSGMFLPVDKIIVIEPVDMGTSVYIKASTESNTTVTVLANTTIKSL